jgi:hypothetical protein
MRRQWTVQRTVRAESNGQHRWDRAYQQLLAWTKPEQDQDHGNRSTPALVHKSRQGQTTTLH